MAEDRLEQLDQAAQQPDVMEALALELEQWLFSRGSLESADSNPELSEQERQKLKALGYL